MGEDKHTSLEKILAATQQLLVAAQAKLAGASMRRAEARTNERARETELIGSRGMSETDFLILSCATVAPGRQRRMRALLRENARRELEDGERRELDSHLEEADRIALLKARAAFRLAEIEFDRMVAE